MELTNLQIINLSNSGVCAATAHTLNSSDAYKLYVLQKFINKQLESIQASQKKLAEDCGVTEKSYDETGRLKKEVLETKEGKRFSDLMQELNKDIVACGEIKHISYEAWHSLGKENREKKIPLNNGSVAQVDIFSGHVGSVLEGIFWVIPDENATS